MGNIISSILDASEQKKISSTKINISKSTSEVKSDENNSLDFKPGEISETSNGKTDAIKEAEEIVFAPFDVTLISGSADDIKNSLNKIDAATNTEIITKLKLNIDILYYKLCKRVLETLANRSVEFPSITEKLTMMLNQVKTYDNVTMENVKEINDTDHGSAYNQAIQKFVELCNDAKYDSSSILSQTTAIFSKVSELAYDSLRTIKECVKNNKNNWKNIYGLDKNPKILALEDIVQQFQNSESYEYFIEHFIEHYADDGDETINIEITALANPNTRKFYTYDVQTSTKKLLSGTPKLNTFLLFETPRDVKYVVDSQIRDKELTNAEIIKNTQIDFIRDNIPGIADLTTNMTEDSFQNILNSLKMNDSEKSSFDNLLSQTIISEEAIDKLDKDLKITLNINYKPDDNIYALDLDNTTYSLELETPKDATKLKTVIVSIINGEKSTETIDRDLRKHPNKIMREQLISKLRENVPGFAEVDAEKISFSNELTKYELEKRNYNKFHVEDTSGSQLDSLNTSVNTPPKQKLTILGVIDVDRFNEIKNTIEEILNEAENESTKLQDVEIDTYASNVSETLNILTDAFQDFYDLNDDGEELVKMDKELGEMYGSVQTKIENRAVSTTKIYEEALISDLKNKMKEQLGYSNQSSEYIKTINDMNRNVTEVKKLLEQAKANKETTTRLEEEFDNQVKNWNDYYTDFQKITVFDINSLNNLISDANVSTQQLKDGLATLIENTNSIKNQYNKGTELYAVIVRILAAVNPKMSAFYNVIINQQKSYITSWEKDINSKKANMEYNYQSLNSAVQDADSPSKANLQTQIEELRSLLVQIKDKYSECFGSNNNSYWERYTYKKSNYMEFLSGQDSSDFYTKIENAVNAFFDVKLAMLELDAANEDSNDLWYQGKLLQIEIEKKAVIEEIKLQDNNKKYEYDTQIADVLVIISKNIELLTSFYNNVSDSSITLNLFMEQLDVFFGEELKKLLVSQQKDIRKQVNKAYDLRNQVIAEYEFTQCKITNFKLNCNQSLNSLKQILNMSTANNYYERMSIENMNIILDTLNIEGSRDNYYSLVDSQKTILEKYDEMCSAITDAYETAAENDKEFEVYRNQLLVDYSKVLSNLGKGINDYTKIIEKQMEEIKDAADVLYCRYADLYNSIYVQIDSSVEKIPNEHVLTVNGENLVKKCDEVLVKVNGEETKTSLEKLFEACQLLWNDLKDYSTQKIVDEYNVILQEILTNIKNIGEECRITDEYTVSFKEKVMLVLNAQIDRFNEEIGNFETATSLEEATKIRNIVMQTYQSCIRTASNEIARQFETKKALCQASYDKVYNLISTKLTLFIVRLNEKIILRKRNIIRFVNAGKILSYLFGHYKIGLHMPESDSFEMNFTSGSDENENNKNGMYPWKIWLQKEIRSCLIPEQYKQVKNGLDYRMDVFNTLMLFTPIVPLIWPYGDSDIEKKIQTSWKETSKITNAVDYITFMYEKKELFLEYINTKLVEYICTAIVNTMDKTCYSSLEAIVKKANMTVTINEEVNDKESLEEAAYLKGEDDKNIYSAEEIAKMENETIPMYKQAKELREKMNDLYKLMYQNSSVKNITEEEMETKYKDNKIINDVYKKYNKYRVDYEAVKAEYDQLMDKLSESENVLQAAYNQQLVLKEKNDAAGYFQDFLNKTYDCADPFANEIGDENNEGIIGSKTDAEIEAAGNKLFVELCRNRIGVENNNVIDGPDTHHSYWKLLRTMSGKLSEKTNSTYMPTFYPSNFPINNSRAEKIEAVIIILNRIFDKLGYVSYDILDIPGKAAQPVLYKDYLDLSIKTNFIDGGRGIDFDDKIYYENRMRFSNVYVPGTLETNIEGLFIDSEETGFNLNNFRPTSTSKPYLISGDNEKYFKFVNTTDLFTYMFNDDVDTSVNGSIDCININSLSAGKTILDYINIIVNQYFPANQSKKTLDLYYATDYLLNEDILQGVYDNVLGNVLNWSLLFPITNPEKVKEKLGYYPISKINTCLYDTSLIQLVDQKDMVFGKTIYEIFDFMKGNKLNKSGKVITSSKSLTPSQVTCIQPVAKVDVATERDRIQAEEKRKQAEEEAKKNVISATKSSVSNTDYGTSSGNGIISSENTGSTGNTGTYNNSFSVTYNITLDSSGRMTDFTKV